MEHQLVRSPSLSSHKHRAQVNRSLMRHSRRRNPTHSLYHIVNQKLKRYNDANVQKSGLESNKETLHTSIGHEDIVHNIPSSPSIILVRIHQAKNHVTGLTRYAREYTCNGGSDN